MSRLYFTLAGALLKAFAVLAARFAVTAAVLVLVVIEIFSVIFGG